jgi:hypothetical protein
MGLPLYIREYVVLSALFVLVFGVFLYFDRRKILNEWWFAWMAVLTAGYFAFNALLFFLVAWIALTMAAFHIKQRSLYLFIALLPAFPPDHYAELPGLIPGIRLWFDVTFPRVLALSLLVVLLVFSRRRNRFTCATDFFVVSYLSLILLLSWPEVNLTHWLRNGFYTFVDFLIIYYVMSRFVVDRNDMRMVLLAVAFTGIMLASVAIFEQLKDWQLYEANALSASDRGRFTSYVFRSGLLRVSASFGGNIPFGVFLVLVVGVWVGVQKHLIKDKMYYHGVLAALLLALIFTVSRGPWIGMVSFFVLHAMLRTNKAAAVIGLVLIMLGVGIAPFVQQFFIVDWFLEAADYRIRLLTESTAVIARNPWFGTPDFLDASEMQSLVQGQGMVDLVNTYLHVTLRNGLVGLGLFVGFNLAASYSILKSIPPRTRDNEVRAIGLVMVSLIWAFMVMIAGVSYISLIPHYHMILIGLAVAYSTMAREEKTERLGQSLELRAVER